MRSSKSRSRGNNKNRNTRPTGGNIINRVFDSSGPDGKVRGTPQQIIEKYNQLHRDAQLSNDRVNAENFAQHAEHYTRLLAEAQRDVDKARDEQEQFNRERQAERDRERNDRLKMQEQVSNDPGQAEQPQNSPQQQRYDPQVAQAGAPRGPQNDEVLDVDTGADSGLVDTPETAPKARRPRPPRKPRVPEQPRAPEQPGPTSSDDPAEAAE
jgi:hypothetical protein